MGGFRNLNIKNKELIIFLFIIVVSIIVRTSGWPMVIDDINCDEAMTAINAKTIAERGTDIYGTSFPVYFEAWIHGGQSAALTYIMAFFIKLFGFNILSIRLPLLIFSIISLLLIYDLTSRMFDNTKIGLIALGLLAISPWHILQSIWSLDCNLFPHVLLISVYLLYLGISYNRRWVLVLSMLSFGFTMYTYGISLYFVPPFLITILVYLKKIKRIKLKELILMLSTYLLVSTPFFLMIIVNAIKLDNIEIFFLTIQHFREFNRTNDMLIFSKDFFTTLISNITSLLRVVVIGDDNLIWNSNKLFGPVYHVSLIFLVYGLYKLIPKALKINDGVHVEQGYKIAGKIILFWLGFSLMIGILINDININRLNILWYPIIIVTAYGINELISKFINSKEMLDRLAPFFIITIYIILFLINMYVLYNIQIPMIESSWTFSNGLSDAISYADRLDKEKVQIISDYDFERANVYLHYAIKYDYDYVHNAKELYYDGNKLLAYSQRYKILEKSDMVGGLNFDAETSYVISKFMLKPEQFNGFEMKEFKNYFVISFN